MPRFLRGLSYASNGKNDSALADYEACLKLNPRAAFAYNARGGTRCDRGDYESAIRDYNQAISICPIPLFYTNRGRAFRLKGELEPALSDLNVSLRQIALKPGLEQSTELGAIARNYFRRHRASLDGSGGDYYPYEERGLIYATMGKTDEVITDLTQAIDRGSQWGWIYAVRGKEFCTKGQYDHALSDIDHALQLGVEKDMEGWVYSIRAIANVKLGKYNQAAHDAKKALTSSNVEAIDRAQTNWILFFAKNELGEGNDAYLALHDAIEINPTYAKRINCGYIKVVNKTNRKVDLCPDYWITADDRKVDVNNNWLTKGTETYWTFDPGETAMIQMDGQRFRAKKFSAWLENSGTTKYGTTWTWTIDNHAATSVIEITDDLLP